MIGVTVPWNAAWSDEERYEVRPCRYAEGRLAMWMPNSPGSGRPMFARPHFVRQRRSIAMLICTVCGEPTPQDNRWWFAMGDYMDRWFATTEAPVHRACAELALEKCPHLRRNKCVGDLSKFPDGAQVLAAIVGGDLFEKDFGIKLNGRQVVGHLKLAWPREQINIVRRPAATVTP